jgi:hypothetical protein
LVAVVLEDGVGGVFMRDAGEAQGVALVQSVTVMQEDSPSTIYCLRLLIKLTSSFIP